MLNQNLARGLLLAAIALFFGGNAFRLRVGVLAHTGPGLFPLMVSSLLLVLAFLTIMQSRIAPARPLQFSLKNIGVIMLALGSFVLASDYLNMMLGIVLLVFIAGFAARTYSWRRNVLISAGLIVVALAFQTLLGLNLGLI